MATACTPARPGHPHPRVWIRRRLLELRLNPQTAWRPDPCPARRWRLCADWAFSGGVLLRAAAASLPAETRQPVRRLRLRHPRAARHRQAGTDRWVSRERVYLRRNWRGRCAGHYRIRGMAGVVGRAGEMTSNDPPLPEAVSCFNARPCNGSGHSPGLLNMPDSAIQALFLRF